MPELAVHYLANRDGAHATVRLELRDDNGRVSEAAESDFDFRLRQDERQNLPWYLEEYPSCPWGAYQDRALTAEASIRKVGTRLFRATFKAERQRAIHDRIADDLPEMSIAIFERTQAGSEIPWELLHDPARGRRSDFSDLPTVLSHGGRPAADR